MLNVQFLPGIVQGTCQHKTGEKQMNPLNRLIREMYPKTHVTPISVMWSVRQAVMGDHVPLENQPFTNKQKQHL